MSYQNIIFIWLAYFFQAKSFQTEFLHWHYTYLQGVQSFYVIERKLLDPIRR